MLNDRSKGAWVMAAILTGLAYVAQAAVEPQPMKADMTKVKAWNNFVASLYNVHQQRSADKEIRIDESDGK